MATVLQGVRLIDGTGADPVEAATVHVEDGRVSRIGGAPPRDAEVIDASGLTVTPGLIDAHVHLGLSSDLGAMARGEVPAAEMAANIFRLCAEALEAGFTTVRDVGGIDGGVVGVVEKGLVRGPRILSAGPLLCQTGGHGHFSAGWVPAETWNARHVPGLHGFSLLSDGVDAMRRNAREAFRRGASFLKLCVTGGVVSTHDELTDTQFTVEEIAAAVTEARARGSYVTVHAHNNDGIRNAVEAGVRCVEHGTGIDEQTAALMASHNVDFVPTLTVVEALQAGGKEAGLPAAVLERFGNVADGMRQAVELAREAGVRVGSGSDLIGPDQSKRGLELALKADVIGAMEALVSATRINAGIIGLGDVGTLEVGKVADLVAFDGDPLDDPHLFNDPASMKLVVKAGAVVKDRRS